MKTQAPGVPVNPAELVTQCVSSIAGGLFLGKASLLDDKLVTDLVHNLDKLVEFVTFGGALNFLPLLRYADNL